MNRRLRHCAILTLFAIALVWYSTGQGLRAQPRPIETPGRKLITPQTDVAIERGLAFLASRQAPSGAFGVNSRYPRNIAVTSLCGMAYLSAGYAPGRGRYGGNVERAVSFILSCSTPSGFIVPKDPRSASHGPMYGHGFATLFLAQAYGISPQDELRDKLRKAVHLIVNSQNDEGGWRYHPDSTDSDVSVTVCQVMALRSARDSGIHVPKETIDRAIEYVERCQNPDGGFRYQLRLPRSEFPRSAAGVVALYSAGIYDSPEIERGLGYLLAFLPSRIDVRPEPHYFYAQYYAVQAMWYAGGAYWERWYPAIRDDLLRRQLPNGSWTDATVGYDYGTAMALIVLQVPNDFMPIFQR